MSFDVGSHVNAAHSGELAHAVELVNSSVGVEHGECRKDYEPVRIGLVRRDRPVVPRHGEFVGEFAVRPIDHGACERQRLDGHALCVHVREALLQVDEFGGQRAARFRGGLKEKTLLGHAEFGVVALPLRIE